MDSMEEGKAKSDLEALLESVVDDNQDYVTKHFQIDFEAYVKTHVHEDLRKIDVVMRMCDRSLL